MKRKQMMRDYNHQDIFWRDFTNLPNNPYKLKAPLNGFKCLLVHFTKKGDFAGFDYPISLGYFASLVRMNGGIADISIQDIDDYDKSAFSGYVLAGIYPMVFLLPKIIEAVRNIKKDYPHLKICLFNSEQHQHEMLLCMPNSEEFAWKIMEEVPSLDYILLGEAEYSFIRLCEAISIKDSSFSEVPACLYRERGSWEGREKGIEKRRGDNIRGGKEDGKEGGREREERGGSRLEEEQGEIACSSKQIKPVDFNYLPFPSRDFLEKGITGIEDERVGEGRIGEGGVGEGRIEGGRIEDERIGEGRIGEGGVGEGRIEGGRIEDERIGEGRIEDKVNRLSPRIQSNRGCCGGCRYCAESFLNIPAGGRKLPVVSREIFKFIDEIEMLYRRYKVRFFNVIDSSFEDPGNTGLERVKVFCDEILKRGIEASFKLHFRVGTISKFDDSFLKKLKEAGADILIVGIESGIERELKSYKVKKINVEEDIKNILRLDSTGDFWTLIGHMMFSACLRLEELPKKAEFMRKLNRGWDYALMSRNVLAFRGTAYHRYLEERGLILGSDSSDTNSPDADSPDKLSPMVSYRYEDKRIKNVSDWMNFLKERCPDVILLQNLLYDSQNIAARYTNKMNKHLWPNKKDFIKFREKTDKVLSDVSNTYIGYFTELVSLAESWSDEKAEGLYKKWIEKPIPMNFRRIREIIDDFIFSCEKQGLSTSRLYLKTWMSLINAEMNTSGGWVQRAVRQRGQG